MTKPVHTTNCFNTFIQVAEDCPARTGEEPPLRAGKPTVACLQYGMIAKAPYKYTSDDVIFATSASGRETRREGDENGEAGGPRSVLLPRAGVHEGVEPGQALRLGRSCR